MATRKRKFKFDTAEDIRRTITTINNLVLNGEIEVSKAHYIIQSSHALLKALDLEHKIKLSDLEQKMDKIEEILEGLDHEED